MLYTTTLAIAMAVNVQQADAALKAQDYVQAETLYKAELQKDPNHYQALYGLARAQSFQGKYPPALETYTRLLEKYPNDPDALLGRGRVYAWTRDFQKAEKDLETVIAKHPSYKDAWAALADVYKWAEWTDKLDNQLAIWQQNYPKDYEPLIRRADLQITQRNFVQARETLAQAKTLGAPQDLIDRYLTRLNRTPPALHWEAFGLYELQAFVPRENAGTPSPWHSVLGSIQYSFDSGTVALQSFSTQRFDQFGQAFVADTFFELWPQAYTNVRGQVALNTTILPQFDILGELYQGFGDGWEASGSYRLMQFSDKGVNFFTLGLGKYLGNWYFRLNPLLFLSPDGPGANVALWSRYYYKTVDDYVELRLTLGRRIATVGEGPEIQGQTNFQGLITGQYFINRNVGLYSNLIYNYDDSFPTRFGGSIGTKVRW